jgi:hypothetical protein
MFNFSDPKLDERMRQSLKRLADRADRLGITSKDMYAFLYADNFLDDLCAECIPVRLEDPEREELAKVLAERCGGDSIEEFRQVLADWLVGKKPDFSGVMRTDRLEPSKRSIRHAYPESNYRYIQLDNRYYPSSWHGLVLQVSQGRAFGKPEIVALKEAAHQLPELDERLRFLTWYGLKYMGGDNLSYLAAGDKMSKSLKIASFLGEDPYVYQFTRQHQLNDLVREPEERDDRLTPQAAMDLEAVRSKMIGRTFAIDKLLEKYRNVLKQDQFEAIEDSLNDLRKKIRKLKVATIEDVLTKTANKLNKLGWKHGGMAVAFLPHDGLFEKVAGGADLTAVVDKMTEISAVLRQRTIIRELAALDLDLFNLGLGHITELQDAQSKLMEGFNSAANKIDDLASKMRSDLAEKRKEPKVIKPMVAPKSLPVASFEKEVDEVVPPAIVPAKPPVPFSPKVPAPKVKI